MSRPLVVALAVGLLTAGASAQALTQVPDRGWSAVDPSGSMVTGWGHDPQQTSAWGARWSDAAGAQDLPQVRALIGSTANGWVMAGLQDDPVSGEPMAARFAILGGWSLLPPLPGGFDPLEPFSDVNDMSANGGVLVGTMDDLLTPGLGYRAFRWSGLAGTEPLPHPAWGLGSVAHCVSADGTVVGGLVQDGSSSYPVLWYADGSIHFPLGEPGTPGAAGGWVTGLDADGSTAVGTRGGADGWLWRADWGVVDIPRPADGAHIGNGSLVPRALADGGAVVYGDSSDGNHSRAWLWTPGGGTYRLRDVAAAQGLGPFPNEGLYGEPFTRAWDCSADGTRVVGQGKQPGSIYADMGFVLDLPSPDALGQWTDLGQGLSGPFDPTPLLTAVGLQLPDSETTLTLTHQPPFGLVYWVAGLSALETPYKGGVMVPSPDVLVATLTLNQTTPVSQTFAWPAAVPAGAQVWWQCWMTNGSGPFGLSASNALRSTAP